MSDELDTCTACEVVTHNASLCALCKTPYCEACLFVCFSCGEWVCEEHFHEKSNRCEACRAKEDGPSQAEFEAMQDSGGRAEAEHRVRQQLRDAGRL